MKEPEDSARASDSVPSGPVLVTGARGFVGRWLVRELQAAGYALHATERDAEPATCDLATAKPHGSKAPTSELPSTACDLTCADQVAALIERVRPRAIIHLAGQAVPRDARRDPLGAVRANYVAVHLLARALEQHAPRARLLYVSSGEVYGRRERGAAPASESDPLRPENTYAATKVAAEQRLWLDWMRRKLDLVIARPFNHTGPGRPDRYAESSFARQIVATERSADAPPIRVGNLEAERDFSDVRDVVRAYRLLLEAAPAGSIFNVSSGRGRTIREVLDILVRHAASAIRVESDPARYEPTPPGRQSLVGDSGALRRLGWAPQFTLEQTLGDLIRDWRQRAA